MRSHRIHLLMSLLAAVAAGCGTEADEAPATETDLLDARRPGAGEDKDYVKKVVLCHTPAGYAASPHTIEVSAASVKKHLAHGDYVGACKAKPDDRCDCKHAKDCDHGHPGDKDKDHGKDKDECDRSGPGHGKCDDKHGDKDHGDRDHGHQGDKDHGHHGDKDHGDHGDKDHGHHGDKDHGDHGDKDHGDKGDDKHDDKHDAPKYPRYP